MSFAGGMPMFNPGVDDICVWLTAFKCKLTASDLDVKDTKVADKCKAILLSSIGLSALSTLTALASPAKPEGKSLEDLMQMLEKHYKPTPKALLERFRFAGRKQKQGESISQFVAELKTLAQYCKFEMTVSVKGSNTSELEYRIRDQFVFGILSEKTQNLLLTKDDDLTLAAAVKLAEAQELADATTSAIRENQAPSMEVHKTTKFAQRNRQNKTAKSSGANEDKCTRCGSRKHNKKDCPHINAECFECGKKGTNLCRGKGKRDEGSHKPNKKKHSTANSVSAIHSQSSGDEVTIVTKVNGHYHEWEFDSGCQKTVIGASFWKTALGAPPLQKCTMKMKAYNGEIFTPLGYIEAEIEYKGQLINKKIPVTEGNSLFGRDLMRSFKLDWQEIISQINSTREESVGSPTSSALKLLLDEYADIFSKPDQNSRIRNFTAKIILREDAVPRFLKARPLPVALREKVDCELNKMEQLGQIKKIQHSDWASPVVVVPKSGGRIRLTGDFKSTINGQLCVNQYPLASPEDLFNSVAGGTTFSKLDGVDAYHQIEVDEQSKRFLVINTHRGLYEYQVLPQGIASSPAIFQECMDRMLQGIPMTGSYLDDGLCSGATDQQHLETLKKVFQKMRSANYRLSQEKSQFMQPKLQYLGHIITKEGIYQDPEKVEDIINMEQPKDVQGLRSFLGLVNFYSKFVPNLSVICSSLYKLLNEGVKWNWSKECENAFKHVKAEIASDRLLVHFDPKLPVGIAADACSEGIGYILFHRLPDGRELPIQFASRTLSKSERNYSQIEKEGLSLVTATKKYFKYLFGRRFIMVTDHKPLLAIFGPKTSLPPLVATRLHHWSYHLSQFQYTIEFRKTTDHGNADALSRHFSKKTASESELVEINSVDTALGEQLDSLPVTSKKLRYHTARDIQLTKVQRWVVSGWPTKDKIEEELQAYFKRKDELHVEQGILMWGSRAVIPATLKRSLLEELHSCHTGIVRMKSLARMYLWWPNLDAEIEQMARSCETCAAAQRDPTCAPLHPWMFPEYPWDRLHIDLAGPFLGKNWLIMVDAHSKWPEIHCLHQDTSTTAIITKLREVIGRFGIPLQIVTDNGRNLVSEEFEKFCKELQIKHLTSSAYHPKTNGEAERMVQTFKNAMKKGKGELEKRLQEFLSKYRQTPHATTGSAPCELLMGRRMRSKLDLLLPDVRATVRTAQQQQKSHHDGNTKMRSFEKGQQVWAKTFKKMGDKWAVGTIADVIGPLTYIVDIQGQEKKRHVDQIVGAVSPPKPPPLSMMRSPEPNIGEETVVADEEEPDDFEEFTEPVEPPPPTLKTPPPQRPVRERKATQRFAYSTRGKPK